LNSNLTQTRQLAAIIFTDIAGYTELMSKDEQKAFNVLKRNREIHMQAIELYQGKLVKEVGDGMLLCFMTVTDALLAAMKIQLSCVSEKNIPLRIGIHFGEIVFENNDIFGDSVNVASRIQSLGVPGSVLFSKKIADEVKNKSTFQLTTLGFFDLKNIEESLEVYALSNPGFIVPKKENIKGKLKSESNDFEIKKKNSFPTTISDMFRNVFPVFKKSSIQKDEIKETLKSLAILPFENASKDSTLSYLTDGIPENLINKFSSVDGIKIFARSATFGLTESAGSIESIYKLLKMDMLLTGRLQKVSDKYFLNCELADATNQNQLWGSKFELDIKNVSSVEESIINSILTTLKMPVMDNLKQKKQKKALNPLAYAEYLKGRHLSNGSTSEESEKALSYFREAIRIDPAYAEGYAAIANEKVNQALFSTASKKEIINEARTAIEAARALDPDLAIIYTLEGALKFYYEWDWPGALASYKKAMELDPTNATIYIRYSAAFANLGKFQDSLFLADKAIELDPISISTLHNLGWCNLLAGNYQKSIDAFGKAIEFHPNWVWGYLKKSYGHIELNEFDEAIYMAESAEKLFKDGWGSELLQASLANSYKKCNQTEKSDAIINRFLKYASENKVEDAYNMSIIYVVKGDFEKAIEWEEKTISEKSASAYLMSLSKFYNKQFFESPEHQQILKKLGFANQV